MDATLTLLNRALNVKPAAAWARQFNIDPSTFAQAKKRKRLSPPLAALVALELGENDEHWGYIAALEQEADNPLTDMLRRWRKRFLSIAIRRLGRRRATRTQAPC